MMIQTGDKVTVGKGKTIWTVIRVDAFQAYVANGHTYTPAREVAELRSAKVRNAVETSKLTKVS